MHKQHFYIISNTYRGPTPFVIRPFVIRHSCIRDSCSFCARTPPFLFALFGTSEKCGNCPDICQKSMPFQRPGLLRKTSSW